MTSIANLTLPAATQVIRGIVTQAPQGTIERIPTTKFVLSDDSGDIRVIYDEETSMPGQMFMLEDGDRVELEGIVLPGDRFLAIKGKVVKKI